MNATKELIRYTLRVVASQSESRDRKFAEWIENVLWTPWTRIFLMCECIYILLKKCDLSINALVLNFNACPMNSALWALFIRYINAHVLDLN